MRPAAVLGEIDTWGAEHASAALIGPAGTLATHGDARHRYRWASVTKLVTALIYMNDSWESPRGRLRLVRSEHDLNDVIAEVPPEQGTLLLFKNDPNAWHGFEPFSGPRRVIQLNWVTSAAVVRREQFRHRISALFKRLKRPA